MATQAADPSAGLGRARKASPLRICIVSSVGGHLREVLELWPALAGAEVFFVLNDRSELTLPAPHFQITHAERDPRVLWNLVELWQLFRRTGWPDVILSTGAGPAVPAALLAKLRGAEVIFFETFGAVEQPSLTGRLLYPLTPHFYYQWPHLSSVFPAGHYVGPVFQPDPESSVRRDGGIFVTVGTSSRPMDRLLRWLDELCAQGQLQLPIFAQTAGATYRPQHFSAQPFLPAEELTERLSRAQVVICHAGAGTLGQCIKLGQRPLLVPRLQRFGEAINDHQLMLAQALARQGQAVLCQDREQLAAALQLVQREPTTLDRSQHDQLVLPLLPKLRALLLQLALGRGKVLD